ncbi:MAG: hypothetical protein JST51_17325 [Armatimonadetes bacterium]|nr:hypothetical protein [Armatimonadota bacterium]
MGRDEGVMKGLSILGFAALPLAFGLAPKREEVTYANRIEPMFRAKCLPCHGQSKVGPFDFSKYEGISVRPELIRTQLLSRNMPPVWSHSDYGQLASVGAVTDQDIVDFQEWVRKGMPKGSSRVDETSPATTEKPVATVQVEPTEKLRTEGTPYWMVHTVDLPKNLKDFDGFRIVPDSPRSLHSATLAMVPTDAKLPKETFGSMDLPGHQLIGVWAAGYREWRLPEDQTMKAVPGSKLAIQAHYSPTGRGDSTGFRIEFLRRGGAATGHPAWVDVERSPLLIDANSSPIIELKLDIEKDAKLISILPEARFFAGRVELFYDKPGAPRKTVFESTRWDPYWLGNFMFPTPIKVEKGASLTAQFYYNNDENCRMNEGRPIVPIKGGPGVSDEVCRMHYLFAN